MMDNYYARSEVSNSDLSWLQKFWFENDKQMDFENAYRFGTLVDAIITEMDKVNFISLTCADYFYTDNEFEAAKEMKKSFLRDEFCSLLIKRGEFQKVSVQPNMPIEFEGRKVTMAARCKWDIYALDTLQITADIKSTTATTEKQFIEACRYFNYFRQRSWYMDIAKSLGYKSDRDYLVGISKVYPFKVFKVPIARDGIYHKLGREQYSELAFLYWSLFC